MMCSEKINLSSLGFFFDLFPDTKVNSHGPGNASHLPFPSLPSKFSFDSVATEVPFFIPE
jgi:hypothetical protein